MNLFLVRHGQTEANVAGRLMGWQDVELNAEGERQAEKTAEALYKFTSAEGLQIHALYSSPLQRTLRTALAIARRFGLDVVPEADLREIHFGQVEGLTPQEWQERFPELALRMDERDNPDFAWPGGESRGGFYSRASAVIDRLVAAHADGDNIIVVTHGGVISSYIAYLAGGDPALWRDYRADNCGITRLSTDDGKLSSASCLVSFNDISHLGDSALSYWPVEQPKKDS